MSGFSGMRSAGAFVTSYAMAARFTDGNGWPFLLVALVPAILLAVGVWLLWFVDRQRASTTA